MSCKNLYFGMSLDFEDSFNVEVTWRDASAWKSMKIVWFINILVLRTNIYIEEIIFQFRIQISIKWNRGRDHFFINPRLQNAKWVFDFTRKPVIILRVCTGKTWNTLYKQYSYCYSAHFLFE